MNVLSWAISHNNAVASEEAPSGTEMTEAQFNTISDLVKGICGINLHDGKKELVKARLNKRLRMLGMANFRQYIQYLQSDQGGMELTSMLDALSTNLTSFFREMSHFEHLMADVWPRWTESNQQRLRVWSAGCSTGEEPYSLAMSLLETAGNLHGRDVAFLATDLSTQVLAKASAGVYGPDRLKTISPQWRQKYFTCVETRPNKLYRVIEPMRELISFARLNLMEAWPMRGPFDVIFCRNVMIYFDKQTQNELIDRFWNLLGEGGLLYIGHSESLAGVRHKFQYVQPTIYRKA